MARKKKSKKKARKKKAEPKKASAGEVDGGPADADASSSTTEASADEPVTDEPTTDGPSSDEGSADVAASDVASSEEAPTNASTSEEPEIPVEDLDAGLDEDADDLDSLIAATVATASAPEDGGEASADTSGEEEPEVTALDEEEPAIEVLDIEAGAVEPVPVSEATDAAAEVVVIPAPSTDEELEGAIDLGDVSSPEARDRLLAQALAHAEMQDARYRVPFSDARRVGRWKAAVAAVLFLVAATVAVAPPDWVRPEPPARIDAATRARNLRSALLLQAQQIDAYRVLRQRLPDTLDELPARLDGIRYVRSGNRAYQLVAYLPEGGTLVYDSTDPSPEFERLRPDWVVGAAP